MENPLAAGILATELSDSKVKALFLRKNGKIKGTGQILS